MPAGTVDSTGTPRLKAPPWPETHLAALRRHHDEGLSATEIAEALNAEFPGARYTRHSVTTRRWRMGLKVHPATAAINNRRHRPHLEGPSITPLPPPRLRTYPVPPGARVLASLAPCQCKWPVGATPRPGDCDRQLFCAGPIDPQAWERRVIYCPDHDKGAHAPSQKARDDARAAKNREGRAPDLNSKFYARAGRAA